MKSIEELDKNMKVVSLVEKDDIIYYDARKAPFRVYGFYDYKNQPEFRRLPQDVADKCNEGVQTLCMDTAGGRIRFATDSKYIAVKTEMPYINAMPQMPRSGSAGFDVYVDSDYGSTYYLTILAPNPVIAPRETTKGYENLIEFPDRKMRYITMNFPLYNPVTSLHIGLQNDARLEEGKRYKHENPVVFYGSSITQGGCASRPGNCYQGYVSRRLDTDYINLGFSGSALGEDAIADYIANLSMSAFVLDYDHNAPNPEHLKNTHEKLFLKVREKHPDLPVVFMSMPDYQEPVYNKDWDKPSRRDVVYRTYRNAKEKGDRNVYFIDGQSLFAGVDRDACTVDGVHPNDLGFYRMADVITPVLQEALENVKEV